MRVIIYVTWLIFALNFAQAEENNIVNNDYNFSQQIDKFFTKFNDKSPGASILIIDNKKTVFSKSYGLADLEKGAKINQQTNFNIASLTKQFTAFAVALLEEKKLISQEDYISKFFPNLPKHLSSIKVKHLIHHNSGAAKCSEKLWEVGKETTNNDIFECFINEPVSFLPGEKFEYSNTGYVVLTLIIEKVVQKPLYNYLNEQVFAPLDMKRTLFYNPSKQKLPNTAIGYTEAPYKVYDDEDLFYSYGDGDIYSSLSDFSKWIEFLSKNKFLDNKLLTSTSKINTQTGKLSNYGYGFIISLFENNPKIDHIGRWCGSISYVMYLPKQDFWLVIFSNTKEIEKDQTIRELGAQIAQLYFKNRSNLIVSQSN